MKWSGPFWNSARPRFIESSVRKAFSETLSQLAAENSRVALLTGDLGFQVFDDFHQRFGPRYVNIGVAEAALVAAAAGMAMEGWRPFAYSIASFITGRAFEQIRITVDYPNLPVVLVGGGGGYTYASSGVTHHAVEDIALMSVLPNMTVVIPGDPNETRELMPQLLMLPGPSYLRIGRYGEPTYQSSDPIVLGRARLLSDGEQIAIISAGDMAVVVLQSLSLLKDDHIFPMAYQMHTIKPLDTTVLNTLADRAHTIVVVEECCPSGGLASAVSTWLTQRQGSPKMVRLGPPDALALGNQNRDELRRVLSYDAHALADLCRSLSRSGEPRSFQTRGGYDSTNGRLPRLL